ncbi:COG4315 family predicted lipoprotein [Streptomyces alkaliterrae]|nr:hypothetical protein [Streptomyces alkaliterrae]
MRTVTIRARIALCAAPLLLALAACGGDEGKPAYGGAGAQAPPPAAGDAAPAQPAAPAGPDGSTEAEPPPARGTDDEPATPPGRAAPASPAAPAQPRPVMPQQSVRVAQTELGRILVDQSGRTLYGFTKDKDGASNCDADCVAVWPALITPGEVKPGDGVRPGMLRTARQGGDVTQAAYGEWPLYYYVGDTGPGETNGQGLDDEWFVVAPDGKLIR